MLPYFRISALGKGTATMRHQINGRDMTEHERLRALLSAYGPLGQGLRFTAGHDSVIADIRAHFHETGQTPDTFDYDEAECIREDIAAIEEILRQTR